MPFSRKFRSGEMCREKDSGIRSMGSIGRPLETHEPRFRHRRLRHPGLPTENPICQVGLSVQDQGVRFGSFEGTRDGRRPTPTRRTHARASPPAFVHSRYDVGTILAAISCGARESSLGVASSYGNLRAKIDSAATRVSRRASFDGFSQASTRSLLSAGLSGRSRVSPTRTHRLCTASPAR